MSEKKNSRSLRARGSKKPKDPLAGAKLVARQDAKIVQLSMGPTMFGAPMMPGLFALDADGIIWEQTKDGLRPTPMKRLPPYATGSTVDVR